MSRVLRPGGSFVCMSYGVPKDREPYLRHDSQQYPWDVSVKCCKKPNLRDVKVRGRAASHVPLAVAVARASRPIDRG